MRLRVSVLTAWECFSAISTPQNSHFSLDRGFGCGSTKRLSFAKASLVSSATSKISGSKFQHCKEPFPVLQSSSFPNVSIGNPGKSGTRPPIKTFGGDAFGDKSDRYLMG